MRAGPVRSRRSRWGLPLTTAAPFLGVLATVTAPAALTSRPPDFPKLCADAHADLASLGASLRKRGIPVIDFLQSRYNAPIHLPSPPLPPPRRSCAKHVLISDALTTIETTMEVPR